MAGSAMHYGPLDYHQLGRVYPRSRLRAPWGPRRWYYEPALIENVSVTVSRLWVQAASVYVPGQSTSLAYIPGPSAAVPFVPGAQVSRVDS